MIGRLKADLAMRQGLNARLCSCVKNTQRRFSTVVEPSKVEAAGEDKGWPMKYKVAGGVLLGTIIPWLGTVAVANDPDTRETAAMISPAFVAWLRSREGGQFWDEDVKRLEYVAHAADWMNKPVTMEVRTPEGESRRLRDLDARMPFTSVARMVYGGEGTTAGKSGGNGVLWLTDFEVLDEGEGKMEEGEPGAARQNGSASTWDSGSLTTTTTPSIDFSPSPFAPFSAVTNALRRDIEACNVRSWWDIAAQELERATSPSQQTLAAAERAAATAAEADQARTTDDHLGRMIEALEKDKLTGARSVDDVKEEVGSLRKQQRELRRKYRKRFLGLF